MLRSDYRTCEGRISDVRLRVAANVKPRAGSGHIAWRGIQPETAFVSVESPTCCPRAAKWDVWWRDRLLLTGRGCRQAESTGETTLRLSAPAPANFQVAPLLGDKCAPSQTEDVVSTNQRTARWDSEFGCCRTRPDCGSSNVAVWELSA